MRYSSCNLILMTLSVDFSAFFHDERFPNGFRIAVRIDFSPAKRFFRPVLQNRYVARNHVISTIATDMPIDLIALTNLGVLFSSEKMNISGLKAISSAMAIAARTTNISEFMLISPNQLLLILPYILPDVKK